MVHSELNPCEAVRRSAQVVASTSQLVTIDDEAISTWVSTLSAADLAAISAGTWDSELHFSDPQRPDLVCQYLLVVDALNFCFWPDHEGLEEGGGLEYADLAGGLKRALDADSAALDAARLAELDGPGVRRLLGWPRPLPLEDERARLLREVGAALLEQYGGQAANLVRAAGQSAVQLVRLVTAAFPGFRDQCVYGGRQLCWYKRAQIFAGDVWGAFGGQGLGTFPDIGCLTMFADYRVPVVLQELGILRYAPILAAVVQARHQLAAGGGEEVAIRAATILAVERLRAALAARLEREGQAGAAAALNSVQLDWWLWEQGERNVAWHRPHHRVLTVFY